ncbi:MAG: hypothetical protein AUK28_09205 [Desulfobacterales bacterium CG2_30_60_27]|nr:MAG: hypothetical protein AUK28_09205 [Desulfobacterales bacterium CG2_30_60_27]
MFMQAMILAAGLGTRLRPYSMQRPKPLFPVLNRPLLLRHLDQVRQAGGAPIVVNAHHLGEQIARLVHLEPDVVLQTEQEILGTGGGLRLALEYFGPDPILVVNGDIYHTIDLRWVMAEHRRAGGPVTLVLHDYPRFNQVEVAADLTIRSFGRQVADRGGQRLAFTGIQVVEPEIMRRLPARGFADIIACYEGLIQDQIPVRGLVARGHFWADIGTPADYLGLHGLLLGQQQHGAGQPSLLIEPTAIVATEVRMQDWVCVGAGARIGQGAELTRVVVWEGAIVESGARLDDAIVTT